MKLKQLSCAMAALGAMALSSQASAQTSQTVPLSSAYTFVGMVGNQGRVISMNPATGACSSRTIGGVGGLTANSTIFGTATSDFIGLIAAPATWCGQNMTALVNNGFTLTIRAGSSGDWVDTAASALVVLVGDSGNDLLVHPAYNGQLWGTGGDDHLIGSTNDAFFGENDNDTMCAGAGTNVSQFNGGSGTDYHCGIPGFLWSSTLDCTKC
jgi:hypothetical protein